MTRPLLLGHRGVRTRGLERLSSPLPMENSIAAFAYAVGSGCDGFEFDVRHTSDGFNVLWHDAKWQGMDIAATKFADLTDRNGARLSILEEVLQRFGPHAYLDIELKVPGNEASVVVAVKAHVLRCGFILSSFHSEILANLHDLDADLPLGFICDRAHTLPRWRDLPIQVLLPHDSLVHPELAAKAHENGLRIMTWTVNDASRMRELAEWGIDGLISDDPRLLYQTFHSD